MLQKLILQETQDGRSLRRGRRQQQEGSGVGKMTQGKMMQREQLRGRIRRQCSGQGWKRSWWGLARLWMVKKLSCESSEILGSCPKSHRSYWITGQGMQTSVTIFSYWSEFTCQLSPTGTGQHLGGKCWGISQASRSGVKNICVCMRVLCFTFCHCCVQKLPVHCDRNGWLVGYTRRQFKLRKQCWKWLFKIKVSCFGF